MFELMGPDKPVSDAGVGLHDLERLPLRDAELRRAVDLS